MRDFPAGSVYQNPPANAGTWAQSLVWENPTYHGAAKPIGTTELMCRNYWSLRTEGPAPQRKATAMRHTRRNKEAPACHNREAYAKQCRPRAAKNTQIKILKRKWLLNIQKKIEWMNKQSVAYLYTGLKNEILIYVMTGMNLKIIYKKCKKPDWKKRIQRMILLI